MPLPLGERAAHHFAGGDVFPVVGDNVRAPGHHRARVQILLDRVGAQQARDAEERRHSTLATECGRGRGEALVDFGLHRTQRHFLEGERVIFAVRADHMTFGVDAAQQIGIAARHSSDDEIVRLHAFMRERFQHAIGVGRHRPIVEGEHHLFVVERQCVLVLHGADARILARIDVQHAARSHRAGVAGATLGLRSGDAAEQCEAERDGR